MLLLFPILRRLLFTAAFLAMPLVAAEIVARALNVTTVKTMAADCRRPT